MPEFKNFTDQVKRSFDRYSNRPLYKTNLSGADLWDIYLKSFPEGTDGKFRDPESSSHNCLLCRNFITRFGGLVAINDDMSLTNMFDIEDLKYPYDVVAGKMSEAINKSTAISRYMATKSYLLSLNSTHLSDDSFIIGTPSNIKSYNEQEAAAFGVVEAGDVRTFSHFNALLPSNQVKLTGSMGEVTNALNSGIMSFTQLLWDTKIKTIKKALEYGNDNILDDFKPYKDNFDSLLDILVEFENFREKNGIRARSHWIYKLVEKLPYKIYTMRAHIEGSLIKDLQGDKGELYAVNEWNKRIDPENFKQAKSILTAAEKSAAVKYLSEGGYEQSFLRRFAIIDDIKARDIAHMNMGETKIATSSVFDSVVTNTKSSAKQKVNLDKVKSVSIEEFMKEILPKSLSLEAYVQSANVGNFVALTTAQSSDEDIKPIFNWGNNYSKTYINNMSGKSRLAKSVQERGGSISGVFRFTHSWNKLEPNNSLMDLHVFLPTHNGHASGIHDKYGNSNRVGWNNRSHLQSGGVQDVDYTEAAPENYIPVENITFKDISRMPVGTYKCKIHNWAKRTTFGRGEAEIAFGGVVYEYEYPATTCKEWIDIAEVTLDANGVFTIKHLQPLKGYTSKNVWGIDTNTFTKVNLMCMGPNSWGEKTVGLEHYMFMLEGCKTDKPLKGFHPDDLIGELHPHRKFIQTLASAAMIEPSDDQLCGVGFRGDSKEELVVKYTSKNEKSKLVKIIF